MYLLNGMVFLRHVISNEINMRLKYTLDEFLSYFVANIDNTLSFCDRVLWAMLERSCMTNFRFTRLQFRGMGPIWQLRE